MEGEDIDALRAEWRDRIGDMSDAEIDEEIVGNTIPVILSDKETAQDFAERFLDSDEKKSAFRRLIDSIIDFLKRAYDKLKNYKSWRTMKTLEGNIQAVQDIREVMFDALDELRNGDVKQNDSAVEIKESEKSPKNDTKKVEQPASPLSLRSVKAENGRRYEPLATATTLFDIATIDEKSESVKQAISALGDIYTSIETNKPLSNGRKTVRPSSLIGNMVSLGILKRGGEGGSAYRSDNGHTLRISYHSANSENFVDHGENLSVALFDDGRMNFFFEGKNNVIEAVFRTSYLEQNTDAFKNMIGDIARFIATGEYHDTAGALTYHYSGSENFVLEAQERMLNDAIARETKMSLRDESSATQADTQYMTLAEAAESGDLDAKNELQDMVFEKAYSLGYTYRRNTRNPYNPQNNAAPYYMFVDMFGHTQDPLGDTYGPYRFVATDKNAIDVSDIADEIQALAQDYFGYELSDNDISPPDIVDSAGMWDNMDFVQEVWDNILERIYDETGEIPAVKTADGLLVFGADGKRIKSADPVVRDENGEIVPLSKRFDESSDNIRYSLRDSAMGDLDDASTYSYENLTSQKDMQVVTIADTYSNPDSGSFRADVVQKAMAAVRAKNNPANTQRRAFVTNTYTGQNIQITPQSIRHGLKMRGESLDINTRAALQIGDIVENAIPVNQLKPREGIDSSYLYIGIAEDSERYYPVAVVVNRVTETQLEAEKYGILSNLEKDFVASLGTKKGALRSMRQGLGESRTLNVPTITIADLLETVKPYYADGVSQSVLDMLGVSERPNGTFSKGAMLSLRDTSSIDIATVEKENAQLREANEELRKQFQRTVGVQLDQKAIRKMARDLLKQYDSSYDVDTLTDNLSKVFDVVANGGLTWDEASSAVVDMCRKVLEESSSFDAELYEYDQPVRDYLKNVRLEISDDMRGGIELVADNGASYRRGLFGIVGTAKKGSGVSIDQMWREASELFPAYFSEDIVNAEEQAERLYHLSQRLKKSSYFVNAFAQNIDAAAYDMMLQIGAKYPGIPHTQTFADKFAAKVNEARAKTKKAYDAKLAQLRTQQKTANRTARRLDAKATKIANRMLQQQARYESQLESQNKKIERMEAARDKAKDTARRKKYRDRISKNATALYQWLAKPTDKAHVPENIRAAVTQLVRAIDLSSGTKYGEAWRQRLSALADQFDKSTLDAAYQSFANSIDPDLTTDIRAFVDSQTGVTVSDMDADHLQTLSELLNRVKKAVTEANKFHASERSRTVQEVAIKTREEFNRKRVFSETKNGKAVQAIIDFNQADAATLFHYLGKEAETIYNAVRQGFDEYVFHVRDARQYAAKVLENAGDKKQYSKTHKFHVDGKDIELSVAQIMTLYELSQRPQASEHLYDGGIVLIKRSATGTQKEKTHVRVTKQDVADMIAVLTDPQKTAADALQRFLQDDSAAWGNDATMTVYGYRKFGEDHYFPIDSDRDFISTSGKDSSNNGDLYALRNWRSSKSTVEGASNTLIVGDIFDVWTKHVSEMAKYGAYLAPMDDMLKWYNWRGRDGSGRQISVRESLNGAFGKKNAAKFVETFIKNINGSGRIDVAAQDKIFDTMVRNAKAAAVGANLSVAIQQPTAYARAYAEIGLKYLSLAFAQKPNTQLAQQYCPIAQWKAWGFFDVNVGPILKSVILGDKTWLEKIREVQMFLPELGDNVTWGYIWNACALEVADKENVPTDQRNTEEFYQKVGRRMSEVIDKTQVVDSPFTRSFISSNKGYQAFTAFRNEPMKSYNMLTRSAYDNVYEHTKETKKHLRRSIVAFVAAGVFAAMGKAIISALRRNDDKKGDSWAEKALIRLGMTEEGRYTYGQKWMVSALEETADNIFPLNTHWLTSAIVEMIERAVSGTNYSSGRIDEKTISSIEDFAKLIKNLTEGKDVETYRLVYKGAEMVSYLTGIGFQSLLKDFKGIANAVSDAISPDYTPTMNDAFILIERGDVGSVEIAAALEAAANEILAKTPSISGEKAMQQAESDLRSKVANRYKDDYINAFEKGYTQKAQQITEWMYATGLYEDRDAVDDVVRGWLVGYYKEAYLAAKTDSERSNIFEKLYATKKWRNRAELKKAIRGWTEAKD